MAMLGQAKPLASLSSGLLARKGQARPAMRRQGYDQVGPGGAIDDLGWNDMGFADAAPPAAAAPEAGAVPPVLAVREALAREVAQPAASPAAPVAPAALLPEPESVAAEPVIAAAADAPVGADLPINQAEETTAPGDTAALSRRKACRIARESAAQTARGKAAFTLRLDPARHLRLRLASAVAGQSAQAIVAGALDRFLLSMPEVEALAGQLPSKKARS